MKWLQSTNTPTGITSVHKETDPIFNQLWKKQGAVVHAITLIHERLIGFHIARLKRPRWVCAKRSLILRVVHPCFNPAQLLVTKWAVCILGTITLEPYIV
jgi:hypothetical protein